jgi:hypothetical protein
VPLAGASITAVDGSGAALSTAAVSQVDGSYALYLAPDAGTAALQIGPYVATDGGTAQTSPLDPFPTYQPVAWAPAVDLPLTAVVNLSGHVIDSTAAPVPGARVYARSVNASWTLSRSVVADTVGAYALTLRAGNYMVQAAPGTDATLPALSDVQSVSIASAATLADVICPAKVRRNGRIYGPDGRQVTGNYQIVATRLSTALVTTRTITTASDPTGFYRIAADAGRWRFEVIPPADAALPRAIAQFDLDPSDPGESSLPGIQIPPPLKLGGTVKGSATGTTDVVVPGAQVSFFALDSEGHSVFLGGGLTDSMGRYDVIVPDVGQASLGP